MHIVRSILAVVLGAIIASVTVGLIHHVGHWMYPPAPGTDMNDPAALASLLQTMPVGALVMIPVAWEGGAFVGGIAAALIAGRRHCLHATIVGGWILFASALMIVLLPHPIWIVIAGLALPIPLAMLAGKLVGWMTASPTPTLSQA